ncbi:MAG: amidohydrolase family protein [Gemmatimonadetes bacterium]|nr:amidohydrolase family protein [Gemmatimonadota bacterium]
MTIRGTPTTTVADGVSRRASIGRPVARAIRLPAPAVRILAPAALLLAVAVPAEITLAQDYDVLIRNGRIIDGTGNDWFRADIAIDGDRIVRLGRMPDATASRVIDATGMYVSPGFIDLHSHSDQAMTSEFLEARRAKSLNSQGLTTVIGGADGRNARWPLSSEIAALRDQGHAMNFVPMVGHSTVRNAVMRNDYERPATAEEMARMRELVRQGMEAGAWGLGAGIEYRPARFSTPEEVIALASEVAPYDGFYVAHQRSEATMPLWQLPSNVDDWPVDGLQGLQETINIARETGIRVVASHHKARGRSSFGRSGHDTLVVNAARAEGLEVYLDVYPYETFGGGARPMIPRWSLVADNVDTSGGRDSPVYNREGMFDDAREHLTRRWNDPAARARISRDIAWIVDHNGGEDRVVVVDYPDSSFVGRTLTELAGEMGVTYQEVVVHMALNGYPNVLGGAWTRGYGIHDVDVVNYYRQEYTATASDAGVSGVAGVRQFESRPGAHPRHFGAFTRKIAHYVKDLQAISLPFAIRSMTGLPARIIGLDDRGLLREGYKADVVIFDLERLRDRATVLEPDLYSDGVDYVMVNGVLTIDNGEFTDELPGEVVLRGGRPVS